MYWKVRTYTAQEALKQRWPYIALGLSLLFNLFLFSTRPNPRALNKEQKHDFNTFARDVTSHLLDNSYISWAESTQALLNELDPPIIQKMQQSGDLPKTNDEVKAIEQQMTDRRSLSAIRITQVNISDPSAQGLVPVEVQGDIARYASDEAGPSNPRHFHFAYLIGVKKNQEPVVASISDMSQQ